MRKLNVTRSSDEDLGPLCALKELNCGVLNELVGRCLIELRQELSRAYQRKGKLEKKIGEQGREIEDLRKKVAREQSEKDVIKAAIDEQQRKIGELESESQGQERTIVSQASEIEGLKTVKQKCEDELAPSIEANGAQGREFRPLKHDNKRMKVKEDRLVEEVGKLKEEIRQMAAQRDSHVKELAEVNDLLNKS
jgi:septal ring factor EnvC (AmiA/AmiB activator)